MFVYFHRGAMAFKEFEEEWDGRVSVQQHLQLEEMAATETVEIFTCIQMCLLVKIYFSTLDYIFLCCYMLCFFHFCSFFSQQYAFGE